MSADDSVHDEVRAFLERQLGERKMPSATWRIEREGQAISSGAVGFTLVAEGERARESTPYDLASLTKPLATALLALSLEDQGVLDLEADASELLEELRGSGYASVSLLDLGSHRAGLPAWKPLYLEAASRDAYVRAIAGTPPAAARGTTLYSDLGYILLGVALERASSTRLDRLFEQRVRIPLGLPRIGYAAQASSFEDAAPTENGNAHERAMAGSLGASFAWRERIPRGEVHDGNAHALSGIAGHAGLFGSAIEVAAIAGSLLDPAASRWSTRARRRLLLPVGGEGTRTFGLVTARDSSAARDVLPDSAPGHTGFTGTSVWLDPATARVFVLLSNRVHPAVRGEDFQELRRGFHRVADLASRR